jgi:molybdopterin synthase catalytic subunit
MRTYDFFLKDMKEKAGTSAGMILVHNGVVRDCTRDGMPVSAVEVSVDWSRLKEIIDEARRFPGIKAVEVEINECRLKVGDDIMLLGVAGDVRENVLHALTYALNRIKKEVTRKKEFQEDVF